MELMAGYEDNHFDLAIVDPPYFAEYGKPNYAGASVTSKGISRFPTEQKHWEVPDSEYFNELCRVSKNQIIWGCNYYAKHIERETQQTELF